MIKSFKDKETENIFNGIHSKKYNVIQSVAKRKLDMIHFAYAEKDLIVPPANRFEHLKGNLKGYCSIRINDQFRIVFKFQNGNAENVYIDDYH
ncbi:MAG: type II toxin-antitoxin system RelE/ParE family toxin [Candidatus Gastranaerophilales bacterium]|nr:type II toxin-antitoxin system RelE/ParE family toxin [Candidatus Gastranaerophilales bacterium]